MEKKQIGNIDKNLVCLCSFSVAKFFGNCSMVPGKNCEIKNHIENFLNFCNKCTGMSHSKCFNSKLDFFENEIINSKKEKCFEDIKNICLIRKILNKDKGFLSISNSEISSLSQKSEDEKEEKSLQDKQKNILSEDEFEKYLKKNENIFIHDKYVLRNFFYKNEQENKNYINIEQLEGQFSNLDYEFFIGDICKGSNLKFLENLKENKYFLKYIEEIGKKESAPVFRKYYLDGATLYDPVMFFTFTGQIKDDSAPNGLVFTFFEKTNFKKKNKAGGGKISFLKIEDGGICLKDYVLPYFTLASLVQNIFNDENPDAKKKEIIGLSEKCDYKIMMPIEEYKNKIYFCDCGSYLGKKFESRFGYSLRLAGNLDNLILRNSKYPLIYFIFKKEGLNEETNQVKQVKNNDIGSIIVPIFGYNKNGQICINFYRLDSFPNGYELKDLISKIFNKKESEETDEEIFDKFQNKSVISEEENANINDLRKKIKEEIGKKFKAFFEEQMFSQMVDWVEKKVALFEAVNSCKEKDFKKKIENLIDQKNELIVIFHNTDYVFQFKN